MAELQSDAPVVQACKTELETSELAGQIAAKLPHNRFVVFLEGELGAGKTTLVRGILRALGIDTHVKSPTYTLVETYDLPEGLVHHFDLYRMEHPEELEFMGGREYFEEGLCFVEWPEKGSGWLPDPDLLISISIEGNARHIASHWQNSPT